jgi:hypothetical protein
MQKWYVCVYVRSLYLQPKRVDLGFFCPARLIYYMHIYMGAPLIYTRGPCLRA